MRFWTLMWSQLSEWRFRQQDLLEDSERIRWSDSSRYEKYMSTVEQTVLWSCSSSTIVVEKTDLEIKKLCFENNQVDPCVYNEDGKPESLCFVFMFMTYSHQGRGKVGRLPSIRTEIGFLIVQSRTVEDFIRKILVSYLWQVHTYPSRTMILYKYEQL
jgi:hypothetical protein